MHYVSNVLGIKDPIHKQKIALKAMDVVLFGPPRGKNKYLKKKISFQNKFYKKKKFLWLTETGTRWKDYILVTLLLSAIIGCWYAYQQNKNAKRHLRRMAQDMEGLQRAEQSLQEMQKVKEKIFFINPNSFKKYFNSSGIRTCPARAGECGHRENGFGKAP